MIHAAALKRVDATANDSMELVKTNVLGTSNVLRASLTECVRNTLLISSDKACLPANAYGASKFMAEQLTVNFNVYGAPRGCFSSVVRYGNVLWSRGSVLTVWETQNVLTLTEPGMTRFVITMTQAVHLIESALNTMEGGEVFVPMLPACSMEDLLEAASGMGSGSDARIYTSLRPGGEKRHKLLMSGEEAMRAVDLEGVSIVLPHQPTWREKSLLADVRDAELKMPVWNHVSFPMSSHRPNHPGPIVI